MSTENEAYTITRHDITNNKVTHRTITPANVTPVRPVKPEIPSRAELKQAIVDLQADIERAGVDFDQVQNNLEEFYAPQKALEKRVSELRAALAQAEQELAEIRSVGSPFEAYKRFVSESEQKVSGIARQIIERYSQDRARDKFDSDFARLSPTTQKDIQVSVRLKVERFASQFYPVLHKQFQVGIERAKGRAFELIRDLKTILEQNF